MTLPPPSLQHTPVHISLLWTTERTETREENEKSVEDSRKKDDRDEVSRKELGKYNGGDAERGQQERGQQERGHKKGVRTAAERRI